MSIDPICRRDELELLAEFYDRKIAMELDRIIAAVEAFRETQSYANFLRVANRFQDIERAVICRGAFRAHSVSAQQANRHLADYAPRPDEIVE